MYYIAGLGNPGKEYEHTRHNTGRITLSHFLKKYRMSQPVVSKKYASLVSEGKLRILEAAQDLASSFAIRQPAEKQKSRKVYSARRARGKEDMLVLWPETYMNKSGSAVVKHVTSAKRAKNLIVVYDDLDLPLGVMKISYGRGSGGHRGIESIIKALKTRDFIRIRVGITPATPTGRLKKPKGEENIIDFLMGEFKKPEQETLKKVSKRVSEALETIITNGLAKAMNEFN